ncbi:MAG: CHAP domain-containing protein [Burkholderiaceae bacterium]|jgi:hypothetical protein|nr:CHAP domain-containing protein [Burkholderiaceae bacterium]
MSFDIEGAVSYARLHAKPKSGSECAKFTRRAISKGGINIGHTESAKNYGPNLEQAGFVRVYGSPQKGDVVVMQSYPGATGPSVHGHMAIYDGFKWISDFVQKDIYPGSSYRQHKPPYQIYRYSGE